MLSSREWEKKVHILLHLVYIYTCVYTSTNVQCTHTYTCAHVGAPTWWGPCGRGWSVSATSRRPPAGIASPERERERARADAATQRRAHRSDGWARRTHARPPPPPTEPTDLLRPASRPHPSTTANSSPPLHSIPSICSKINQLRISKCYEVNLF